MSQAGSAVVAIGHPSAARTASPSVRRCALLRAPRSAPLWYPFSIIFRALREGYERQTIDHGVGSGFDTVGRGTDHGSGYKGTHRTPALAHRHTGKTGGATGECKNASRCAGGSGPNCASRCGARTTAHEHDTPPPPDVDRPEYPTLKVAGFSDFNFAATDLKGPSGGFGTQTMLGPHTGFQEGQFVLHMSSALSSKVSAFGNSA